MKRWLSSISVGCHAHLNQCRRSISSSSAKLLTHRASRSDFNRIDRLFMSLLRKDVEHIARLARIALTDRETDATLLQLQSIFTLIEKMQAIDTHDMEPLTTPLAAIGEVTLRLRDDVVTEPDRRDALLALAPATQDGLFLVPRVIE
jgi:aspartyl-tRNA(Asn)/glutamyl-tRNA(Gln) amidotransferase subunit C